MKRILVCTLLSFLLAISAYIYTTQAGMSYCTEANKAALEKDRRLMRVDKDGKHLIMKNIGECYPNGSCVIQESYGPCGMIRQFLDHDNDGVCDIVVEWKSIVDPEYGVFFGRYKTSRCPITV